MKQAFGRQTATVATLRTIDVHEHGDTIFISSLDQIWKYDATSTATDDGTAVAKPANVGPAEHAGRWLISMGASDTDTDTDTDVDAAVGVDKSARSHKAAVQSLPSNDVDTQVLLDTSEYDTDGMWDGTNHQFVIKTAGKYKITAGAALAGSSNALPDFQVDIFLNGAAIASQSGHKHDTDHIPLSVSWLGVLAVNDEITLSVAQDSGNHTAAINLEAGAWLALQKVDKAG